MVHCVDTSTVKNFHEDAIIFQWYEPNCGKMPRLAMLKNLTSSSLSTDMSLVKFSRRSNQ